MLTLKTDPDLAIWYKSPASPLPHSGQHAICLPAMDDRPTQNVLGKHGLGFGLVKLPRFTRRSKIATGYNLEHISKTFLKHFLGECPWPVSKTLDDVILMRAFFCERNNQTNQFDRIRIPGF